MAGIRKAVTNRTLGAGDDLLFKQIQKNATGTGFEAITGTDVLGQAANTWHQLGTITKSPGDRQESGSYQYVLSVIEDDITRRKLIRQVAPPSTVSASNKPELKTERGVIIESNSTSSEVSDRPFFLFIKQEADLGGKETGRVFVGQFAPTEKRPNDPDQWNVKDLTVYSVDALGYVTAWPADVDLVRGLFSAAAPTLASPDAFGADVIEP